MPGPVVLESPVINMHSPVISPISRVQFVGHMHAQPPNQPAQDMATATPSSPSRAALQPRNGNGPSSPYATEPTLRGRNEGNIDPSLTQNGLADASGRANSCANCGSSNTPLWRRDGDGNTVCNACATHPNADLVDSPPPLTPPSRYQPVAQDRPHSASPMPTSATTPLPPLQGPPRQSTSPALPPQAKPSAQVQKPAHLPGTCPGDGRCDAPKGEVNATDTGVPPPPSDPSQGSANGHPSSQLQPGEQPSMDQVGTPANGRARVRGAVGALSCANCGTSTTPLWRRDDAGNNICNACACGPNVPRSTVPTQQMEAAFDWLTAWAD
ncbi:hypothetical protein DAEQUDRAFT_169788 [Daedalea quercina L-15889]|uniref:GATA-type domain-containing protein n=1 Tax=Daedalea quercina L-15889 TaxID=1314783 RepID=A0A165RJY1_9APHY|nr:hypothetical protein DAEQUDRAFT_169788 [Daedalea quercina L-15889]